MVKCSVEFRLPANHVIRPCCNSDLVRVGSKGDGGYCLTNSNLSQCDFFISVGLGQNVDFEEALMNRLSLHGVGIDPGWSLFLWIKHLLKMSILRVIGAKVTLLYEYKRFLGQLIFRIRYPTFDVIEKKCVRSISSKREIGFGSVLAKHSSRQCILLKIDIEGDEYEVLEDTTLLGQVSVLIVEFHDINKKYENFEKLIQRLLLQFHISHVHINPYVPQSSNLFPNVVEITFEKSCGAQEHRARKSLPLTNLDTEENASVSHYKITFE